MFLLFLDLNERTETTTTQDLEVEGGGMEQENELEGLLARRQGQRGGTGRERTIDPKIRQELEELLEMFKDMKVALEELKQLRKESGQA